jgi:uncharacterized protein (TIGR03000 family)
VPWQNLTALFRQLLLVFGAVAVTAPAIYPVQPAAADRPPQARAAERRLTSRVFVAVPADDAELVINGETIPGHGVSREFETSFVAPGDHEYTVTVTWKPNSYTTMTRTKMAALRAGEPVRIDLTVDDPRDRVRVIYVPTPADVATAMVDLAGVGRDDVVYEPGCGDARITVAAIRKGARRGICVDIDPERARESQANVTAAGFADRIDVREGDALDVKDLSDVSVVFLYMGDHFNLLVRPVLWRELKVGSRIVSHRFTMGDWMPDRTVAVTGEDGLFYEVHLWTITDAVKQKQNAR